MLRPRVLIDPGNDVNLFFSNQIFEKVLTENIPGENLVFFLDLFSP